MEVTPEHSAYVSASLDEYPRVFDDNDNDDNGSNLAAFRVPYGDEGEFNLFEQKEHPEQDIFAGSLKHRYATMFLILNLATDRISRRYDYRTRRDRVQKENEAWQIQMKGLEAALLEYRLKGALETGSDSHATLAWKGKAVSLDGAPYFPFCLERN